MKIKKTLCKNNPCYKTGRKITVNGLMLHSVGCPQPKASVFVSTWDRADASVCPHAVIDGNDGTIYKTLPWEHRGWHCGSGVSGSANNTHIGVEMCEPSCIRYTSGSSFTCYNTEDARAVAKKTYKSAVALFAKLCRKYGLNPLSEGVIISHREGCARGISSNHGDPEHLWNGLGLSYTMDGFRKDIKKKMKSPGKNNGENNNKNSDENYKVRVTADELNVRKGPGTYYVIVETVKRNDVFTITEEKTNEGITWGRLKSGLGYISLSHTKKL